MELSDEELTKIVLNNEEKVRNIIKTLNEMEDKVLQFSFDFTKRCNENIELFFTLQQHPCINFNNYSGLIVSCADYKSRSFGSTGKTCPECNTKTTYFFHSTCLHERSRKGHQTRFCQDCILLFHNFSNESLHYLNSIKLQQEDVYKILKNNFKKNFDFKRLMTKAKFDGFYLNRFQKKRHDFPYLEDEMYRWYMVYAADDEPIVTILYCFEKKNTNIFFV
jgi:hypothetical protein